VGRICNEDGAMPPGSINDAGLHSKVWLPSLTDHVIARPRLESRLEQWKPVTVARAPQGYGKTTVVASWLNAQSPRHVTPLWVTATAQMPSLAAFNDELARSMRSAGMIEPARSNTSCSGAMGSLHETLLSTSTGRRVVLVIDDIWHVPGNSIFKILLSLVERHRHFHLILCGRGHHPVESLAAACADVNTIAARELALDVNEIAALARQLGKPLAASDAARLASGFDGRVSVIRLIIEATQAIQVPERSTTTDRRDRVDHEERMLSSAGNR
jgi:LuxR family maltose regulon positive regulatory protein